MSESETDECSDDEYTDNRKLWEWDSKYPADARTEIKFEAKILASLLLIFLLAAGFFCGVISGPIRMTLLNVSVSFSPITLATFFAGGLGGTTFSLKWLVHAAAKGRWHLDRRYWRLLVPLMGGVYACVVLSLWDAGMFSAASKANLRPISVTLALAFMVGYFSDGVSGLLTNIANAVFGTVDKK